MRVREQPDAGRHEEHPEDREDIVGETPEWLRDITDQREIRQEQNEADDRDRGRAEPRYLERISPAQRHMRTRNASVSSMCAPSAPGVGPSNRAVAARIPSRNYTQWGFAAVTLITAPAAAG